MASPLPCCPRDEARPCLALTTLISLSSGQGCPCLTLDTLRQRLALTLSSPRCPRAEVCPCAARASPSPCCPQAEARPCLPLASPSPKPPWVGGSPSPRRPRLATLGLRLSCALPLPRPTLAAFWQRVAHASLLSGRGLPHNSPLLRPPLTVFWLRLALASLPLGRSLPSPRCPWAEAYPCRALLPLARALPDSRLALALPPSGRGSPSPCRPWAEARPRLVLALPPSG